MKRPVLITSILLALAIALVISGCTAAMTNAAKLSAYDVGGDSVPSVNSVVGERKVTGVESTTNNGVPSKQYTYQSDSVFDDLVAYLTMLREKEGWLVTEPYDLNVAPGSAQLGKQSKDEGQILILSVAYEDGKYAIKITKLEGTLE